MNRLAFWIRLERPSRQSTRASQLLRYAVAALSLALVFNVSGAAAQDAPTADESLLGELLITGDQADNRPRLAVLPSLSPALEDVIVRSVVRRNFELTGLYRLIPDSRAPQGFYGFTDPVDVKAWQALGAQVVVKVAARENAGNIEVFGLAYLLAAGKAPVYKKRITVSKEEVRVTAHRITDALLGALTGRAGGFASRMTFASRWGRNYAVSTIDADGHDRKRLSDPMHASIAPAWGPAGYLFFVQSQNYSPFRMMRYGEPRPLALEFESSVYSLAFNADGSKLAVSVGNPAGSTIFVGNSDGTSMQKVSNTEVATHPVFSPSGKLAWIGGGTERNSGQRVYVDGKPVSPGGFSAAAPVFCDTENGVRLVYSVAVGGGRSDLVWSTETGQGMARLTQGAGSNTYPACSPDGRMLAFFSERKKDSGLYIKSLKSFSTQRISGKVGQSLRWAALPPPTAERNVSRSD